MKNASFQQNASRLVSGFSCDIVHGLSQVFPQDVYRVGEPLHLHGLITRTQSRLLRLLYYCTPRHQVILSIERNIFKPGNFRRIIVNSRLCRRQVIEYYNVPEERIRIVYNGVDLSRFSPDSSGGMRAAARKKLGLGNDDRVLLFAGNDFKRKGLVYAMQTARKLRDSGCAVRLIIAGRGSRSYAARCAAASDVADAVLVLGSVENPQELYHAADLLVLPTRYDPFANVCLEAMACGIPVVTTRSNGASELIEHGVSGIIVARPQDTEPMAAAITRFFDSPQDERAAMGHAAAATAREYPLERMIEKTLAVYEEILREKQGVK